MNYVLKITVILVSVFAVSQSFCETSWYSTNKAIRKEAREKAFNEIINKCAKRKNKDCVQLMLFMLKDDNSQLTLDNELYLFEHNFDKELYSLGNETYLSEVTIRTKDKSEKRVARNQELLELLKKGEISDADLKAFVTQMANDEIPLDFEVQVQMNRVSAWDENKEEKQEQYAKIKETHDHIYTEKIEESFKDSFGK